MQMMSFNRHIIDNAQELLDYLQELQQNGVDLNEVDILYHTDEGQTGHTFVVGVLYDEDADLVLS
jgi:hypothetical protein